MQKELSKEAIHVLSNGIELVQNPPSQRWELYIGQQLSRPLYEELIDAFSRLEGKWNRGAKAILFPLSLPVDSEVSAMIERGTMPEKNPNSFFSTPPEIANLMMSLIRDEIKGKRGQENMTILEPSAGRGGILDAIVDDGFKGKVVAVEIDPYNCEILVVRYNKIGGYWPIYNSNFLYTALTKYQPFDFVLMNPPFTGQTGSGKKIKKNDTTLYTHHIYNAFERMRLDGILVSVVPHSFFSARSKPIVQFRRWVEHRGTSQELPVGAFKSSGTSVKTGLIVVRKNYEYNPVVKPKEN